MRESPRSNHSSCSVGRPVGRAPSPAPYPLVRHGATWGSRAVQGDRPTTVLEAPR
jgi:hypothetical protein